MQDFSKKERIKSDYLSQHGVSILVNHYAEGQQPFHAHVMPIYQSSRFSFPDHAIAIEQMLAFGGMLSFELKGGLEVGETGDARGLPG